MKKLNDFNYLIDTEGNIYHAVTMKKRVLKLTPNGYLEIGLKTANKSKWYRVHRLVAQHYIPNPENKPFVNHINGIKTDNRVENLEWVTHTENMKHASETGLCPKGEMAPVSLYTDDQIRWVCKLMEDGYRNIDIEPITGVNQFTVSLIRGGTCWVHISKDFKIPKKSRTLSVETLTWIKRRIDEGLTQGEIMKLANNPKINKWVIQDLRRGYYKDIK